MLNAVVSIPILEKRSKRLLVHGPSVKTPPSAGVAKTYWVPRALGATGTGGPQLTLREKPSLYLLFILGYST
jgi:hypothetical protein